VRWLEALNGQRWCGLKTPGLKASVTRELKSEGRCLMGGVEEESSGDAWHARWLSGGRGLVACCRLAAVAWPAELGRNVVGLGRLLGQKSSGPAAC
jgi:hypothetical protein